jgi:putative acetyltransferase
MTPNFIFKTADTDQEFEQAKVLFLEYAASLDIDLSFQNFSKELESVRLQYDLPTGALILAYKNDALAGCAGIRRLDDDTGELKRMYVRPEFRGLSLGKELLEKAIQAANALGYRKLRLDTLASMTTARRLYEASGFEAIEAYYYNPIKDVIYMEKVF